MPGRVSSNHCVCVSVCVCVCVCVYYRYSERYECFKTKVRYQQKALYAGNKINVGIEPNFSAQKSYDSC